MTAAKELLVSSIFDRGKDAEIRVALDFDEVLADDSASKRLVSGGISAALEALDAGRGSRGTLELKDLLAAIAELLGAEREKQAADAQKRRHLEVALVTTHGPGGARLLRAALRELGVSFEMLFLVGAADRSRVLEEFRPHVLATASAIMMPS